MVRRYQAMNPKIAGIQEDIKNLKQLIKTEKNEAMLKTYKEQLKYAIELSKQAVRESMKYKTTPDTEMSKLVNQGHAYFVDSHGESVARKKFKLLPGQYVVFLAPPGICILSNVIKNRNFVNTFFGSKIKISKFLNGKMQYLKSHVWANAYKRIYTPTGPPCPDLRLSYEDPDDPMGVRSLPSGKFLSNFNHPDFLSKVLGRRPGVYFVFACREYFRNNNEQKSIMRAEGKKIPFRAHTHGARIVEYENKAHRIQRVKRNRNNNNENTQRLKRNRNNNNENTQNVKRRRTENGRIVKISRKNITVKPKGLFSRIRTWLTSRNSTGSKNK